MTLSTRRMEQIQLHPKYQNLFHSKSRYFLITGGRGSGKSFSVSVWLLLLTYEEGHKVLFTRYTMMSAHTSIIPEFIEKIDLMDVHSDFRITKDEIINLTTKSSIIFKGIRTSSGNQTAALKSLSGVTTLVVEEAEELVDEDTFMKIDFSIRGKDRQNRVVLILNPASKEHWIFKRWFQSEGVPEGFNGDNNNVTYIHTDYRDNKENLADSFLAQVEDMKRKRPDKYLHTILGSWISKSEGAIYKNWRVDDFQETDIMCYGQDFGFSKDLTTLVKISVDADQKKMWVQECYGKEGLSTTEIGRRNKQFCGLDLIICDNSEPRLLQELKDNHDLNIRPTIKKKGSILSGIALMQDYEIMVDRGSHGIIRELNNYIWQQRNAKPLENGYDHYLDACRYALQHLVQGRSLGRYAIL